MIGIKRLVSGTATLALALSPAALAATTFPFTYVNPDGSKVIIPSKPTRVVDISQAEGDLDLLASIGVHPIAAQGYGGGTDVNADAFPDWENGGELNGIQVVGNDNGPPDYEKIASLNPDLILVDPYYGAAEISQLEAIAPTVQEYFPATEFTRQFGWQAEMLKLAPIFDATARADSVVARLMQREDVLKPFVKGTSVASMQPFAGTPADYAIDPGNGGDATMYYLADANVESKVKGLPTSGPNSGYGSEETLPNVTASKLIVEFYGNQGISDTTEKAFKASPLYHKIPAEKKGQVYFTDWFVYGPIGNADMIQQLQKEMYGVTGLEATLKGTGSHKSSSGVADIDVGPTDKRVCWDVTTTGAIGSPNAAVIEDAKGATLFALGNGYHTTGCTNVTKSAGKQLLASSKYLVAIEKNTTVLLHGTIGMASPAFFGNGKDTYYKAGSAGSTGMGLGPTG